jgi:hypothetical protein
MPAHDDSTFLMQALEESNEILHERIEGLEKSNKILRTVVRKLRATVNDLREIQRIAADNDKEFVALCQNDGEVDSIPAAESGLPEDGISGLTGLEQ